MTYCHVESHTIILFYYLGDNFIPIDVKSDPARNRYLSAES